MYVRVYDAIELDTIAEMSSESASTRLRINLVVIGDENRKIINATAPSKLRPSATYKGVLAEREIEWLIVTLTNFACRRRRVPDSMIKQFEMCIERTQDVVYMKLRSASPLIQRDLKTLLVCMRATYQKSTLLRVALPCRVDLRLGSFSKTKLSKINDPCWSLP